MADSVTLISVVLLCLYSCFRCYRQDKRIRALEDSLDVAAKTAASIGSGNPYA